MNAEAPVKPGADGNYEVAIPGQWKLPWAIARPGIPL
jgi:hypothetical protein